MSGGVGPCSDIRLPKDETVTTDDTSSSGSRGNNNINSVSKRPPPRHGGRGSFTFRQLNALAVMVVLSASGMVSMEDFAFVLFSIVYIYFISKVAFPRSTPPLEDPVFDQTNRTLSLYVFAGATIGLFLPIAYVFEGIFEGDKEGIKAAAPHVFLLASQVFMEGVALTDRFSIPVRVFVPVLYNSRRIFTLVEWLRSEIVAKAEEEQRGSGRRLYVGRVLAVVNMGFWSFNLFCFLLPVYLPKTFKLYYSSNPKHA
ncbi:unnamed protein product [Cuscuta europaea]|uniref:DUF7733 domain-containing protein n=1 Tax=Cuscuta europaea TaxID=41803 RepID=A0A9P0ZS01_CUSEU|nr:unnamed protein product [Cuscuta europaea]